MSRLYIQAYAQRRAYEDLVQRNRMWETLEQTIRTESAVRKRELDDEPERRTWFYRVARDEILDLVMIGTREEDPDWSVVQMMVTANSVFSGRKTARRKQ